MVTINRLSLHICLMGLLLCSAVPAFSAQIKVFVDQGQIRSDQSFRLFFEADGSVDDDPEFTPLKQDFELLGQSLSSSTTMVNGSISNKKTWILSLVAKQSGHLKVPAISFGKDKSPPLALTVSPSTAPSDSNQSEEIILEVSVEPKTAYVQQQILYSIRLLRRVKITNARLSEPELNDVDCIIEKIGEDRHFERVINGRRYLVIERQYALFPQQSGLLKIAPIHLTGQVVKNQRSFFGQANQAGPIRRVSSSHEIVKVKPVPPTFTGGHWLPARNFQIEEQWSVDPAQQVVGEPATRTLRLSAYGLLASQLPDVSTQTLTGFKLYPDQPKLETSYQDAVSLAVRQEKVAFIPNKGGNYQLPEIKLHWWNTETDQQETTNLPAQLINVATPTATTIKDESDFFKAQQKQHMSNQPPEQSIKENTTIWKILSFILAFGWLATCWIRFRGDRSADKPKKAQCLSESAQQSRKQLKAACLNNDPIVACSTLLKWGKQTWPQHPPSNLSEVATLCGEKVSEEITILNMTRYGPDSIAWDGEKFWRVFSRHKSDSGKTNCNQKKSLESLYRPLT